MAAIYTVTNGVTAWDQGDVNQYATALNNVLGITDTAQDALGRLVAPRATVDPGSPSVAQAWFRTDLGVGGRLLVRHGNTQTVPYLPLRQVQKSGLFTGTNSGTQADVASSSVNITTTGGRLRVWISPGNVGSISYAEGTSDVVVSAALYVLIDGSQVAGTTIVLPNPTAGGTVGQISPSFFMWDITGVAAGAHTVKLQASTSAHPNNPGTLTWTGCYLVVEEWGD